MLMGKLVKNRLIIPFVNLKIGGNPMFGHK